MKFIADLHIHSRFSRATSKNLTINALEKGALKKGVTVLGTGDFTHPAWSKELEENLTLAEPGLFRIKGNDTGIRFLFTTEISTIYKQDGAVRKVHNLIAAPDVKTVHAISASLAKRGNIISDGRPILGITSKELLAIVLEANENAFIIPAHIWTPWFSVLGSKSGFNSIKECFGDLEPYIFAVETGLSSDPLMNWQVSSLDRYHLISNSDAHSAEKIGREATLFDANLDYFAIRDALKTGTGLAGTIEFFPEEGKYHMDGHRTCKVVLEPEETRGLNGICPVCKKPLTIGVLYRVKELSDRAEGLMPENAKPFYSLIPLAEILGEIMGVGPSSEKVKSSHERLVHHFKGELPLLLNSDLDEIKKFGGDVLALAISKMRNGEVEKKPGFDGEFGRIKVFSDKEMSGLFKELKEKKAPRKQKDPTLLPKKKTKEEKPNVLTLNKDQTFAIESSGKLIVRAGPGTGKTRVLVERTRHLVQKGIEPKKILAITFTTKAAQEIRDRLNMETLDVYTFHALAAKILKDTGISFELADEALLTKRAKLKGFDAKTFVSRMLYNLSTDTPASEQEKSELDALKKESFYPFESLIAEAIETINASKFVPKWDYVMVDEFQDINSIQYRFLKALGRDTKSIMVIGDPFQSIYGFRGSNPHAFDDFLKDFPEAASVELKDTYRLNAPVSHASNAFIGKELTASSRQGNLINVIKTASPAAFIAKEIEALAGGLSSLATGSAKAEYSLRDIAVIVRTSDQMAHTIQALKEASIPFETANAKPLSEIDGVRQRVAILENQYWTAFVKGIGEKTLERIEKNLAIDAALSEKIQQATTLIKNLSGKISDRIHEIEHSGLFKLPKMDKEHEFYKYAHVFGQDLDGFIKWCALSSDQDSLAGEKVRVITAHAAKGLEFACVFIAGLNQGMFPLASEDIFEEKNLFYVAMTRAIDNLYLVCSSMKPSIFIDHIPREYISIYEEKFKPRSKQLSLFDEAM